MAETGIIGGGTIGGGSATVALDFVSVTPYTTPALLEAAFPEADPANLNKFAIVGTTDADDTDGLWGNPAGTWTKMANDSDFVIGVRSDGPFFDATAIAYKGTDEFLGETYGGETYSTPENVFDGNDSSHSGPGGGGYSSYVVLSVPLSIRKFRMLAGIYQLNNNTLMSLQGLPSGMDAGTPGDWVTITIGAITGVEAPNWAIVAGKLDQINGTGANEYASTDLIVTTADDTIYDAYKWKVDAAHNTGSVYLYSMEGYVIDGTPNPTSNLIDACNRLHLLSNGVVDLTDGATVSVDAAGFATQRHTVTQATTYDIANASEFNYEGRAIRLRIVHDGANVPAFHADIKGTPTLSTGAGEIDILTFVLQGATLECISSSLNVS